MTYSDFIDRVNGKVRTDDEWPEATSVTQQQVDFSYLAALAVASVLPLSTFSSSDFTNDELSAADSVAEGLDKYSLPNTVFQYRESDLGIVSITLDGLEYQLDEAVPLITIRKKSGNALYKDATLFSADLDDRLLYVLNVNSVKLKHLTEFDKPATGDIATTDYPFSGTHAERAASIVATHVNGELKRDNAAAQFQALLQKQYTSPQARREEAQPESGQQ